MRRLVIVGFAAGIVLLGCGDHRSAGERTRDAAGMKAYIGDFLTVQCGTPRSDVTPLPPNLANAVGIVATALNKTATSVNCYAR